MKYIGTKEKKTNFKLLVCTCTYIYLSGNDGKMFNISSGSRSVGVKMADDVDVLEIRHV